MRPTKLTLSLIDYDQLLILVNHFQHASNHDNIWVVLNDNILQTVHTSCSKKSSFDLHCTRATEGLAAIVAIMLQGRNMYIVSSPLSRVILKSRSKTANWEVGYVDGGTNSLTFLFSSFANETLHFVQKPVIKEKAKYSDSSNVKDTKWIRSSLLVTVHDN